MPSFASAFPELFTSLGAERTRELIGVDPHADLDGLAGDTPDAGLVDRIAVAAFTVAEVPLARLFPGVAEAYVETIPRERLSAMGRNALTRAAIATWGELGCHTVASLMAVSWVGRTTVEALLRCCVERSLARLEAPAEAGDVEADDVEADGSDTWNLGPNHRRLLAIVGEIAAWASQEEGAETFGDVWSFEAAQHCPDAIHDRWLELSSFDLHSTGEAGRFEADAADLAEELLGALPDRSRQVFETRTLRIELATFAELGRRFGVTPERVRQVQCRADECVAGLAEGLRFRPLHWRASRLAGVLGTAVPRDSLALANALDHAARGCAEGQRVVFQALLLWLAGPYVERDGWLEAAKNAPTIEEFEELVERQGLLALSEARAWLAERGVREPFVQAWIERAEALVRIDDSLLAASRST